MDINKIFDGLKKNTIELVFYTERDKAVKGCSKFGGKPDIPESFEWPYFCTNTFDDDEIKPRALAFLMQINCEEISEFDKDGLLPDKGMLYFFYELGSQRWGFDPKDRGCARVYYYAGEELETRELPDDMEEQSILPEIPVGFKARDDVPGIGEYFIHYDRNVDWDEYYDSREERFTGPAGERKITKLLGYGDEMQGDMLAECEMTGGRGIYTGNGYPEMTEKEKNELLKASEEWTLLFQLDTVRKNGFELMFGDDGRIFYYIRKDDLKNKNFENIWIILQCG